MNFKYKIIIISLFVFLGFGGNTYNEILFLPIDENNMFNVSYKKLTNGENGYVVKDLSYEKSIKKKNDFLLSFNKKSFELNNDDTCNYIIEKANYLFSKDAGSLGEGCAKFYKRNDGIRIKTEKNLWLGKCGDLGSFTIEFRFKTLSFKDDAVFFMREGYRSGKKIGFNIGIKNERVVVKFYNLFKKKSGKSFNVFLNNGQILEKGKWYSFLLSYNSITGYLVKKINDVEEESIYITESGSSEFGAIKAKFPYLNKRGRKYCVNQYDVEIAKDYIGFIDEFRITHYDFDQLKRKNFIANSNYGKVKKIGRVPLNNEGIIQSPVYSFPGFGTKVVNFNWQEEIFPGTAVRVEFRISDYLFYKNNSTLKWYRIKNNQKDIFLNLAGKDGYLRGKYFQWRAYLTVSPDGKYSPYYFNPKVEFREDKAPEIPIFLQKVKVSDKTIFLRWKKNVDSDLRGYKIYYGTEKGRYDGVISFVNDKRLDNDFVKENFVEVKIDNKIIEENRMREVQALLTYPLIK